MSRKENENSLPQHRPVEICVSHICKFQFSRSHIKKNHRGFHRLQAVENRSVMGSSSIQVSTHHCLLWMIRTQKPLENLSKIHALRIPHTECLILWPRLVDFPSQGACEWPESAASESVGLEGAEILHF